MLAKIKSALPLLVVLIVSSLLFLTNLGKNTLANWDEAWYADASRHMFRDDHFLTPVWNNNYFFDKPPLQYWLTQPFLCLFGEKEIAYRLPSALAAIGLTLTVFFMGKEKFGYFGGLGAAAILLTFPHFLDRGRSGNFDALFIFFTTVSLFFFTKRRFILSGVLLGLSWLTKGMFSGLFPPTVIVFFGVYDLIKHKSFRVLKNLIIVVLAAVLVYAPWHLIELNRFDDLIEKSYFGTFDQGEFGDWSWMSIVWRFNLRYLVFLWTFWRWWFPVGIMAVAWLLFRANTQLLAKKTPITKKLIADFMPLAVFTTVFLALSATKAKNDWYIMPVYPWVALMVIEFLLVSFRKLHQRYILTTIIILATINIWGYRRQAFPPDKHLELKQVAEYVRQVSKPEELVVTAEYEFPTLRYYSEREVRTAARQGDFAGKYWWVWDNIDIATALRQGRQIVTVHRPGTEWTIDVWGWERVIIGQINGRIISRIIPSGG